MIKSLFRASKQVGAPAADTSEGGAAVLRFPPVGWCVRPGFRAAHFFIHRRGTVMSACGGVRHVEVYVPRALCPSQASTLPCANCERELSRHRTGSDGSGRGTAA